MAIDYNPLRQALVRFKKTMGSFVDLERATEQRGDKVSAATFGRWAKGKHIPSNRAWESIFLAFPNNFPPPSWQDGRASLVMEPETAKAVAEDPLTHNLSEETRGWLQKARVVLEREGHDNCEALKLNIKVLYNGVMTEPRPPAPSENDAANVLYARAVSGGGG